MWRRCSSAQRRIRPGQRLQVAGGQRGGVGLDPVEEGGVADQRHLHRLGQAGDGVAAGQAGQEVSVADHGVGRDEGAQEVLGPEGVDAVLHPHARVVLAEHGGGHAHRAQAPVGGGGGVPGGVQHRAAAGDQHVGVAVDAVAVKQRVQAIDDGGIVLGPPRRRGSRPGSATSSRCWRMSGEVRPSSGRAPRARRRRSPRPAPPARGGGGAGSRSASTSSSAGLSGSNTPRVNTTGYSNGTAIFWRRTSLRCGWGGELDIGRRWAVTGGSSTLAHPLAARKQATRRASPPTTRAMLLPLWAAGFAGGDCWRPLLRRGGDRVGRWRPCCGAAALALAHGAPGARASAALWLALGAAGRTVGTASGPASAGRFRRRWPSPATGSRSRRRWVRTVRGPRPGRQRRGPGGAGPGAGGWPVRVRCRVSLAAARACSLAAPGIGCACAVRLSTTGRAGQSRVAPDAARPGAGPGHRPAGVRSGRGGHPAWCRAGRAGSRGGWQRPRTRRWPRHRSARAGPRAAPAAGAGAG